MSMEQGTTKRLTTVFILLLVLATGSVLGVAVDRRLEARATPEEAGVSGPEASGTDAGSGANVDESVETPRRRRLIVEEVGLSEPQKIRVDSIVSHYRERNRSLQEELQAELQEEYRPRYRELVAETRAEIKKVLTGDQQRAYDSLLVEHDRRRQEERRTRDTLPSSGGQERN